MVKVVRLDSDSVLAGYDAVSALYPFVPSLSHWRAWEHAAYQHYRLDGRVLDLGCGDGRYFRLLWPQLKDVVGIEADPAAFEAARQSGVYAQVHLAFAHELPVPTGSVDVIFANCSLEHMDHLDRVLGEAHRCLAPGGRLLCSVVTDRFVRWQVLPWLLESSGQEDLCRQLQSEFADFHHLVNPLSAEAWQLRFAGAGFVVEEHVPILPQFNGGLFLLVDAMWHLKRPEGGELGDVMYTFLSENARFPKAYRTVLKGVLEMETDWLACSGAVFCVRRAP